MADSTETKPNTESTGPKPVETETKPTTDPVVSEADFGSKGTSATEGKATVTEIASNAASTASAAVVGVKDSMFSMFGGGAKKEKKVEEDDEDAKNEPSGSSKAQKKDADAEDVCIWILSSYPAFATLISPSA
jgi:Ran-binding protein 1